MLILSSVIALGLLGIAFGLGLAIASDKLAVDVDPRVEQIEDVLPGVNCGACGQTGCPGYAEAVVAGETEPNKCTVGGPEVAAQIAEIMGVEHTETEKEVAVIMCRGSEVASKFEYYGVPDCRAAALLQGGPKGCQYGCLGLGTCSDACMFEAIRTTPSGLPEVIEERCVGCGKCVDVCPRNLVELHPISSNVHVQCKSRDKGGKAKKICKAACIGCKKCEKVCKFEAIAVDNFLALIDYEKCKSCGPCVKECPQEVIVNYRKERKAKGLTPPKKAKKVEPKEEAEAPAAV